MSNNFYVGQKVVFHGKGSWPQGARVIKGAKCPGKKTVLTVRSIDHRYTAVFGQPGILVAEVVNKKVPYLNGMMEPAALADNFSPAVFRFDFDSLVTPAALDKFKREDEQSQTRVTREVAAP